MTMKKIENLENDLREIKFFPITWLTHKQLSLEQSNMMYHTKQALTRLVKHLRVKVPTLGRSISVKVYYTLEEGYTGNALDLHWETKNHCGFIRDVDAELFSKNHYNKLVENILDAFETFSIHRRTFLMYTLKELRKLLKEF